MALINVKKENRVLTIDERELQHYLDQGYEQVKYDGRTGNYKTVTQKKTVNNVEFAEEMTPQAAARNAADPLTAVEFGSEISPTEAAKLGATPADVARAAGASEPVVGYNGGVATPADAQNMEFGGEIAPDASPAPTQGAAAAAANNAANAAATEAQFNQEFSSELGATAAEGTTAPNADYSGEFAEENAAVQKAARKRKQ
jgi:hypothetical protein